ncbi:hypothetical protein BOTBODRAFT_171215 [Botryobasidium botryosum FD-172 SS1]|uniref:WW domain-containing protein n=1 Tax=Botryobasidium botryosum (strain FD-172 SS1) TaxID=930990 RepID=A0A067MUL0_BOTB1|nr:hypothetical protein BOTBODRAFT_171215 [Botryobasidium botryosum FD-172 SS1]
MVAETSSQLDVQTGRPLLDPSRANTPAPPPLNAPGNASQPTLMQDSTGVQSGRILTGQITEEPISVRPLLRTSSSASTLAPSKPAPLQPSENPRYADVRLLDNAIEEIPARRRRSRSGDLPDGWVTYVHPEGKPYYHHKGMNIATYANISKYDKFLKRILEAYTTLYTLAQLDTAAPARYELVIEFSSEDQCQYYFVDHDELTILWAEKTTPSYFRLEHLNSDAQCDLWLEKEYWHHLHNFPFHNKLPKTAISTLMDALIYGGIDRVSSHTSMFPFATTQREAFLGALRTYGKSPPGSFCEGHKTCTIARMWSLLANARFLSLHGHEAARIDCNQKIVTAGPEKQAGWILRGLEVFSCLLLFNTPNSHHMQLKRLWLGKVVMSIQWQKFIRELLEEWSETSLLAGVLLTANVSFWSVSTPDFWTELFVWISAVLALGSVITALLQSRQHRGRVLAPALDVANYMASVDSRALELLPLAISYALPYVLFIWSAAFLGAGLVAFACHNLWPHHEVGRIIIIYMGVMGILPVLFSAYFAWNIRQKVLVPAWTSISKSSGHIFPWSRSADGSNPDDGAVPPLARPATHPEYQPNDVSHISRSPSLLGRHLGRLLRRSAAVDDAEGQTQIPMNSLGP